MSKEIWTVRMLRTGVEYHTEKHASRTIVQRGGHANPHMMRVSDGTVSVWLLRRAGLRWHPAEGCPGAPKEQQ